MEKTNSGGSNLPGCGLRFTEVWLVKALRPWPFSHCGSYGPGYDKSLLRFYHLLCFSTLLVVISARRPMIDLSQWRVRIGAFHAIQFRSASPRAGRCQLLVVKSRPVVRFPMALLLLALLLLGGDLETNPGPPKKASKRVLQWQWNCQCLWVQSQVKACSTFLIRLLSLAFQQQIVH